MQLWVCGCRFVQCDFEYPLKCCLVVTWLVKLLPCGCTYMITMHQVTVHFIESRIHMLCVCLARTCHCTLGRMTRIFYVLLQYHRSGTDSKMSRHRKLILEKNMFLPLLSRLKPDTCYHMSGTLPLSYSLSWWPHELWLAYKMCKFISCKFLLSFSFCMCV